MKLLTIMVDRRKRAILYHALVFFMSKWDERALQEMETDERFEGRKVTSDEVFALRNEIEAAK